jgi:hypothetical protein
MPNSSYMVTVRYGSANLNTPKAVITLPTSSVHVDPLVTPGKIGVDRALIDVSKNNAYFTKWKFALLFIIIVFSLIYLK